MFKQGDSIYLLYAYHSMDPFSENDIPQHEFRQSMIINLFGSRVEPPTPPNPVNLDILADSVRMCTHILISYELRTSLLQVRIPPNDTTYWCRTQRLPDNIIDEIHYVTSVRIEYHYMYIKLQLKRLH